MTERKQLEFLVAKMKAVASMNGSLDPWWEVIGDIDAVLNGKEGIVLKTIPQAVEMALTMIAARRGFLDAGEGRE